MPREPPTTIPRLLTGSPHSSPVPSTPHMSVAQGLCTCCSVSPEGSPLRHLRVPLPSPGVGCAALKASSRCVTSCPVASSATSRRPGRRDYGTGLSSRPTFSQSWGQSRHLQMLTGVPLSAALTPAPGWPQTPGDRLPLSECDLRPGSLRAHQCVEAMTAGPQVPIPRRSSVFARNRCPSFPCSPFGSPQLPLGVV